MAFHQRHHSAQLIRFHFFGGRVRLGCFLQQIFTEPHRARLIHLHNSFSPPELVRMFGLLTVVQNNNIRVHRLKFELLHDFFLDEFGFLADFVVTMSAEDANFVIIAASITDPQMSFPGNHLHIVTRRSVFAFHSHFQRTTMFRNGPQEAVANEIFNREWLWCCSWWWSWWLYNEKAEASWNLKNIRKYFFEY